MSNANENNNIPVTDSYRVLGHRISLWSQISSLSISLLILLCLLMIGSIAFYIYSATPPLRYAAIHDEGDILSEEEEGEILVLAEKIKREKNINVFVVTEPINTQSTFSESDYKKSHASAKNEYLSLAHAKKFKDNSGLLVQISLDNYMFIYTQDRVHACFSSDDGDIMLDSASAAFRENDGENYADAFLAILSFVDRNSLSSPKYTLIQAFFIFGPLLITAIVWLVLRRNKTGVKNTSKKTYLKKVSTKGDDVDEFIKNTVVVTTQSSSGSGGFSGGGSGRSGGGGSSGGGGRSGGFGRKL